MPAFIASQRACAGGGAPKKTGSKQNSVWLFKKDAGYSGGDAEALKAIMDEGNPFDRLMVFPVIQGSGKHLLKRLAINSKEKQI